MANNTSVAFYQISTDNSQQQKANNEATQKKSNENTEMSFSDWKKKKDGENKQSRNPRNDKSLLNTSRSKPFFIGSAGDVYQPLHPPPPSAIPFQLGPWTMPWQPNALNKNSFFSRPLPVQMNRRRDQAPPRNKPSPLMMAKPIPLISTNVKNFNINTMTKAKPPQLLQQKKPPSQPAGKQPQHQQKQQSPGTLMKPESNSQQNKILDQQRPQQQQFMQGQSQHQQSSNASKSIAPGSGSKRPYNAQNKEPSQWIMKPQMPPPTVESKEEKKVLWREYREAMKPFKNREFANAKRVIQRLGKRDIKELDEIDIGRLQRAQEHVATHKLKLSEKAASRWVRMQDESPNNKEASNKNTSIQPDTSQFKAQVYVRKSNIYNNNNQNRGGYHGHNGSFGSSNLRANNSSWGASNRQNNVNGLMGSYSNHFVAGGRLNSQFVR